MELEKVNLYRIVHRENIAYILERGMFCIGHPFFDPNNIFIGNSTLTGQRHEYPILIEGYGSLGDYVPFYFGYRSPMLLNIATGYGQVVQRPQSDIIYIVCKLKYLIDKGCTYVFTDGHAKNNITRYFTDIEDLNQLDWTSINALAWRDTADNTDRRRRKQAECLIKSHVPPQCITALVVFDEPTKTAMKTLITEAGLEIGVHINPNGNFYY